jgi:hypothetical protein
MLVYYKERVSVFASVLFMVLSLHRTGIVSGKQTEIV